MSDLINSIALANIGPGKGKDFVSPTGDQFITAGPTREEIKARAPERGVMGAINDNVIEVANAAAGGVSSIANMISPGNRVSSFIEDEIIKPGEAAQSDQVKAEKKFLQQDLQNAQGAGDEITAYLGYMARNPGLAISQVAGSFAIPGLAAKGANLGARALGMGEKAASRFGLGAVSGVSGAMAGGEAGGSAYELVKRTPRKILEQNAEYQKLLQSMDHESALEEIATRAARSASALPAVIGATLGPLGAERILAGAGRPLTASRAKNAALTGGVDAFTEGLEEGVTTYEGQRAAAEYNPTIDPMKGVAGAATAGAVMGAGPGIALGALQTPAAPNPLQPVVDQAQKPGSVLSRAVVATGATEQPVLPQATNVLAGETAVDPISARVSAVEADLRGNGTLEKIRGLTPEASSEFLYALNIAKNPNTRPDVREQAITQVEQVLETAKSGAAFTMVPPEKAEPNTALTVPGQQGGELAAQQGGPLAPNGMGQFFDPNVVDVDAVRVDNMLPGPRAIEGPRARIGTDVSTEPQDVDAPQQGVAPTDTSIETNPVADSFAPGEQQNVAPATETAATPEAPATPAVKPGAGGTYAGDSKLPAATRKRAATLRQLADQGFETVERRGNEFFLKNSKTGQELKLDGMADSQLARNQIKQAIDAKANTAAASPKNDRKDPTEAQIAAGNYKKSDVIDLNGMKIKIENPKDSIRRGTSPDGVMWETKMAHHYGEFQGTEGADGDKLDVFVGTRPDSDKVFVIDQVNEDGSFDEHKVMMGFTSEEAARAGYLANYEKGWTGLGAITEMPVTEFKAWAKSRAAKKPLGTLPGKAATTAAAAAPTDKARWIKAVVDNSRLAGDTGIQLDVTPDGKLNFLGNPDSSKQGRSLLATLAEAKKAGATDKEIADAIRASKPAAPASQPAASTTQGQFATLDEAKAYISQQRRANGTATGLPIQLADGSFGIAVKGSPQYAEAERQRDARDKPQGEFFTVPDGGKQRKLKKVSKSAMPKKASPRRMGEPRELTQDEATLIEQVAAVLGKTVVFFEAQGERIGDGFFLPNQPGVLYVATETTVNPLAVFGHEFFHDLRETNPEAWNAIAAVVRTRVADPAGFRGDYTGQASTDGSALTEQKGGELEELVSDLGGNLMMDPTFWRDVFAKVAEDNGPASKGIIARLAAALENLIARVMKAMAQPGFRAGDFVKEAEAIRAAYKDGLAGYIKAAGLNKASMGAEVAKASQQLKKTPDRPAQPGSITVEGYHYSQAPRAVLTTGLFGTGLKGSARDEIMAAADDRIKQRLSFYADKGTGIKPEAGVGAYVHKATLTNIYDADADPLRLRTADARAFESKILDAGFSGYLSRMEGTQSGQVILLGAQTVRPELLGTSKVTGAKVVPAPQQREQDAVDRLMANKALPSGMLSPQRWSEVLMSQDPELAAQLLDIGAFDGTQGMYKDELAGKVRQLSSGIRKSADRAKSEYAEVEAKYKGTDEWMKAPNGEATELAERQWVQVRTPSFKAWFGDWEKHARAENPISSLWSDDNVSKAVGKNGEPLVVYHGTDDGGFTEFKAPSGKSRGDLGIWTTPDYGMASSYVRKGRPKDVDLSAPTQSELEDLGYEFNEDEDGVTVIDPNGYNIDGPSDNDFKFRSVDDAVATVIEEFAGEPGAQPGIYALFINVRNPNEDNFEGALWNGERVDQYQVRDENDEPVYDENGRGYFDQDTAERLVEENPGSELQPADPYYNTTDDVVREALRSKQDGAIIREVIDDGGGLGYWLDPQDIFVGFDPSQLKSADYNNGEFSDSTGDLRKSTSRKALNREDPLEMSTRIPTAKGKAVEDHMANLLISDFKSGQDQEKWINTVSSLVTAYPNYREVGSATTAPQKLERMIRQMTDNLVWLHNQVPASTRQRSKLWYDGANAIAKRMAKRYDTTEAQAAGILAALSPQKDWFMNVSLADRVAGVMAERQKFRWSPEMEDVAGRIYRAEQYQVALGQIRGKTLAQLQGDDYLSAVWLRVYDQTYNTRSFDIVSPEGDSLARAQTQKGVESKVAWGGNSTIAKAVSIFRDGTAENISEQLGNQHKVRNFYNNILVPNSKNGHVTIDTHAVAAALLRALSGNSIEVKHNFGGSSNAIKGLQGTYALYEEAYRRAAKELGLLPRELQSITWEAIRGMYKPGFKSQAKNVDSIDKIWGQFKKGRLSYDGAREYALETAGGIEAPSWLGRNPGIYVEEQLADESSDVSGDGVYGRDSEDIVIRADVEDSGAPETEIRKTGDRNGAGLDSSRSDPQGEGTQDGAGRLAPLPGYAHGNIKGAAGPDPRIVEVAEKYARDNGITLRRQAEYVKVDPERAARIADAYEAMPHAPQDPKVKRAFANLLRQTRAQYDALIEAGYQFTFFDSSSDPYQGNPWNAMRDLRQNKRMAVYGTYDGYGTEGITAKAVDDNPMLGDTGLEWEDQSGQLRPVAANDLFRAVHDAFGHGLEGAGFRADGEENAWQAHARLFTGSAVAAITSETRGQNSWLNYGPYGETNRTAKLEGTVFAEQKTGLMPEWTWKEGVVGDVGDIRKSPARQNDILSAKLRKARINNVEDFWRTWRNLMVGTAGPDPRLSALGSKDSQAQRVESLVAAHKAEAEKGGILSVLQKYNLQYNNGKFENPSGKGDDGLVASGIAKRILQSAGINPTVENAIAAYESLPGSAVRESEENVAAATYNQRIAALKDLITCLKK